jgi:hypothetical protein
MIQPPFPLALVLCDAIHFDRITSKATILGVFRDVRADEFPFTLDSMAAYVAVSDGREVVTLSLRVANLDGDYDPSVVQMTEVDFSDPMSEIEVAFWFEDLTFEGPGTYRVQLFAEDEFLMERRLDIV